MAQVPPFAINETAPADDDFIRLFPGQERLFRDIVESWLSMEHDATTGRHKIPTDTTANLAGLSYANGSLRYDTTDATFQVTATAGSTWNVVSIVPANQFLIRNGTATAPRGWTKVTLGSNYDVVASDLASASIDGGTTDYNTIFTSRTISQANLPVVNFTISGSTNSTGNHSHGGATGFISNDHSHFFSASTSFNGDHAHTPQSGFDSFVGGNPNQGGNIVGSQSAAFPSFGFTNTTGGHTHTVSGSTGGVSANHNHAIFTDGAHSHTLSGSAASGGSGTGMNFSVLRIGFLLCAKSNPA